MANIVWLDKAEATGSELYSWDTRGTVTGLSYSTTVKKSGVASYKIAGTVSATRSGIIADTGRRLSFWLYIEQLPSQLSVVLATGQSANVGGPSIAITTAGKLRITRDGASGLSAESTTTLSTGVFYRVTLSWWITSTTVNDHKLYINGVEETACRTTNATYNTINNTRLVLTGSASNNLICYVDSIYLDDGNDLGDPGNILCTAKQPNGDTTVGWDTFPGGDPGAGSRYTLVNERPIQTGATSPSLEQVASGQANAVFTLQSTAQGDVNISGKTQVGYMGWVFAHRDSGSAGTPAIITNNVFDGVTLDSSTPAGILNGVPVTSATYPSHANGIGMRSSGAGSDTHLMDCGVIIAYIEPTGPAAAFLPRRGSFGQDARLRR